MNRIIFVSHSSQDREAALTIVRRLESMPGHSCWFAPRDVPLGSDYPTAIIDAITACDVFLLVLTQHANESQNVHREVERAGQRNKPILTVRLNDVLPAPAIEFFVSRSQWADAAGTGAAEAAELVASRMQGYASLVHRRPVFTPMVATALVLVLALISGLVWYLWPTPPSSASGTATVFLKLWDAGDDAAVFKLLSPKSLNGQSAELVKAQIAQLRQQAGGGSIERVQIADLQYSGVATATGVQGPGQFHHLRFRSRTPVAARCEDLWLESPEPGRWEVLVFQVWNEFGGACLNASDIHEVVESARGALTKIEANEIAARDPEVFSTMFQSTKNQSQVEEYLSDFRGKGVVIDRQLIVASPSAFCPATPAPGRYVFIRFSTALMSGMVVEDLWMEKPVDGSKPRIVALLWWRWGATSPAVK